MSEPLPAVVDLRRSIATPQTVAVRQVMADGIIAVAAKAKDWPLLHEAVDIKIEDQREFVAWWDGDEGVRDKGGDRWLDVQERGHQGLTVRTAFDQTGITKQQVSRWREWVKKPEVYHDKLVLAACRKAGLEPDVNRHSVETGEHHWFTPPQYIEAARAVMGGIDLDPATHQEAQRTVRAKRFYIAEDDGLSKPWKGRVWLNPPYETQLIDRFVAKLITEFDSGRMTEGVLLTHNNSDTRWFHAAEAQAALLCFTLGRIRFIDIDGQVGDAPTQGHTFFYYGANSDAFRDAFSAFGFVR
jgi:hypothetical protein